MKTISTNRKISVAGKLTIAFIVVLQILLTSFICMMLVYYGPFNVIKKYVVGTAMSSKDHQYLATWFLSQEQINNILAVSDNNLVQNGTGVTITNSSSKDILLYEIKSDSGKFHGYLMDVKDPKRIKVGLTSKLGTQGETTSQMAKELGAVAAINGGGFHDSTKSGGLWSGTGALPTFFVISDGKVVYNEVSNNNKLSGDSSVVAFDNEGKLIIGKHSVNELLNLNVKEALVFGRTLVVNGKRAFSGDGSGGITARTAIGQTKDGDVLLLVLDGRRINMPGASLRDSQQIMLQYGAINAVNLDGGASTTMFNNGKVINSPCDALGERTIPTAICVQ